MSRKGRRVQARADARRIAKTQRELAEKARREKRRAEKAAEGER